MSAQLAFHVSNIREAAIVQRLIRKYELKKLWHVTTSSMVYFGVEGPVQQINQFNAELCEASQRKEIDTRYPHERTLLERIAGWFHRRPN